MRRFILIWTHYYLPILCSHSQSIIWTTELLVFLRIYILFDLFVPGWPDGGKIAPFYLRPQRDDHLVLCLTVYVFVATFLKKKDK